jgi:FAD/FMN-containing dehydrogenase
MGESETGLITVRQELTGWGRYPRVEADCIRAELRRDVLRAVAHRGDRTVIGYGQGRAYGDAALPNAGLAILTGRLNRFLGFDADTGWLRCEAGVTIDEIITEFLPRGWFPSVVPGTRFVSVGGALASDVHGKNHHVAGTWGSHVRNVELLRGDGEIVTCDASHDPDLFWATAGGQGLTGIILSMEVRLRPVESDAIELESTRVRSLDEFLDVSASSREWPYSVGWIDGLAKGNSIGRGIFMTGRHAPAGTKSKRGLLNLIPGRLKSGRFLESNLLLNRVSARLFNAAYYRKQFRRLSSANVGVMPYFFPLDAIANWNRMYGRRGFFQYQYVVRHESDQRALRQTLDEISRGDALPFLGVIKEFGDERHGMLSFPVPGVTVALDFPNVGRPALALFDRLDDIVADARGRVYLTKDGRLSKDAFRRMYPDWERWKSIRDAADPDGVFESLQSARLGLTDARETSVSRSSDGGS